jgi:hypothetical protein
MNPPFDGTRAPRLLDQVREAIRTKHYSFRTEKAYVGWIRRFIVFNGTASGRAGRGGGRAVPATSGGAGSRRRLDQK